MVHNGILHGLKLRRQKSCLRKKNPHFNEATHTSMKQQAPEQDENLLQQATLGNHGETKPFLPGNLGSSPGATGLVLVTFQVLSLYEVLNPWEGGPGEPWSDLDFTGHWFMGKFTLETLVRTIN